MTSLMSPAGYPASYSETSQDELKEDLAAMNRIFEEELRRAAFRMADEVGCGVLPMDQCRTVLRSLADTPARKEFANCAGCNSRAWSQSLITYL